MRSVASALALLVLAGCRAVPRSELDRRLNEATVCCSSFDELPFSELELNERNEFTLSSKSKAISIGGRKSFVAAFSLPPAVRNLEMQLPYGDFLPTASYVDPVVVFLDGAKREIATRKTLRLINGSRRQALLFVEYFFSASEEVPVGSRYVVIYPNFESRRIKFTASENGTRWPVPPMPVGTVAIIAK